MGRVLRCKWVCYAVTDSDATYGEVLEITTGGNTVVGIGSRTGDGSTIDTNGYAALEFDLKLVTAPTSGTDIWRLKVENPAAEIGLDTPTLGEWKSYSIPMSDLGTPNTLDLIMLFADYGANAGAVYRIDNVNLVVEASAPPPPPTGNATLQNGDFENGLTSWTEIPDAGGTGTPGTISTVTAPGGRTGSVALLESTADASRTQDVLLTQVVSGITSSDTINVSLDLYGTGLAGSVVFVELIYLDAAGNDNGRNFITDATPFFPSTTWTPYSGSKPAGLRADGTTASVEGGVMLQLKVLCPNNDGCSMDAYFDNVTFTTQ